MKTAETKICNKCHQEKKIDEFYKRKDRDTYVSFCKKCRNGQSRKYYLLNTTKVKWWGRKWCLKNKEYLKDYRKNLYLKNNTKIKTKQKQYSLKNKEKIKNYHHQYYLNNVEKILNQTKTYYLKNFYKVNQRHKQYEEQNKEKRKKYLSKYNFINQEKLKRRRNQYCKRRRKMDINYKIRCNLSCRIRDAVKNNGKSARTMQLVGCTIPELKLYLLNKFLSGMTWDNYGKGRDKWNIDHIIPCSSFDLQDPEQQKKCFHYSNLQPLWETDNLKKGNKIIY